MEKQFELMWRNKWLTADAKTIADMIRKLREAADHLQLMSENGVTLYDGGSAEDDYALLITTDEKVANLFGMEELEISEGDD